MATKTHDVNVTEMCRAIAQQSSLTKAQVAECFKTYKEIIEQISSSPNRPEEYCVSIPYIGWIKYVHVHNDDIDRPIKGAIKHVDLSKARRKEDYERLEIKINKSLKDKVKELSYQKFQKQKEITSRFAKQDRQEE